VIGIVFIQQPTIALRGQRPQAQSHQFSTRLVLAITKQRQGDPHVNLSF